ncbi:hypothetical protein Enr13x_37580 [Stieleria neptunia]|uniref:Uncharacterized protein n=1 Tax=Stieleria neptunia TaxID=2527979 RepID=A0A518HSV0_9BACT|nr:hypothetical protein Enr13x_37580 [Stieleria neptunia]
MVSRSQPGLPIGCLQTIRRSESRSQRAISRAKSQNQTGVNVSGCRERQARWESGSVSLHCARSQFKSCVFAAARGSVASTDLKHPATMAIHRQKNARVLKQIWFARPLRQATMQFRQGLHGLPDKFARSPRQAWSVSQATIVGLPDKVFADSREISATYSTPTKELKGIKEVPSTFLLSELDGEAGW